MVDIQQMLAEVVQKDASDLHIIAGAPAMLRVHGELVPFTDSPILTPADTQPIIAPLLTEQQNQFMEANKEIDFSYQFGEFGRFRVNVYLQKGCWSAALRLIPTKIKSLEELGMPEILHKFTRLKQGLVLVTGPTGHGKSTTLAAMIDEINHERGDHILTIEDPIEFVYTPDKSIISQREVGGDTNGWTIALRSALREDPDVVLVGEMRDFETIASAITVAETGHLVFATLHTNSAAQTIDRIIDVFPAGQQGQIRAQLAMSIQAVVAQRLLPSLKGGRVAVQEIMIANSAIRNLIREGKAFQLDTVIQTGSNEGMMSLETHLAYLIQNGYLEYETAIANALKPEELARLMHRSV